MPPRKPQLTPPAIPLCPYQEQWIADRSRFKIAVKSRRIGLTFATTLEIALDAISRKTRWLIISRTQDAAKEALNEVKNHFAAMRIHSAANAEITARPTDLAEIQTDPKSEPRPEGSGPSATSSLVTSHSSQFFSSFHLTQYSISLPNGSEIAAMTSHPDAARGFGGNIFLDEHAFHRDSQELWKGAAAAVLRGHRLIVVSTPHYQTGNFYRLARQSGLTLGHPPQRPQSSAEERNENEKDKIDFPLRSSASSAVNTLWSPHWIDIHTAAPQLARIGVPVNLEELRELAGDEETWNQEFCCQFLSAAEMWLPLDLIAAARSPEASLDWNHNFTAEAAEERREDQKTKAFSPLRPSASSAVNLYLGADIGRKHDRTQIWIDERIADIAICRGVITLDRTSFERQYEVFCSLLSLVVGPSSLPLIRRACIDQTGIGMALVERLQEKFPTQVEGITFTQPLKEELSLRVRRRLEERLDKIPDNAPAIERDFAAVKREITSSGNLRFDADRTEAGHADIYWAKALADHAADPSASFSSRFKAASRGADPDPRIPFVLLPVPSSDQRPTSLFDPTRPPVGESLFVM